MERPRLPLQPLTDRAGEPEEGRRLPGGYVLGPRVSEGAMGAVHRATAPDGRPVAVKRLLDARNAARFEIEARLLARLRHPRVVRVLDSMMDDTGSYPGARAR